MLFRSSGDFHLIHTYKLEAEAKAEAGGTHPILSQRHLPWRRVMYKVPFLQHPVETGRTKLFLEYSVFHQM